jgi:hydrogenase maturation protease
MLIIGCGNRERSDDGAGILVAERLRDLHIEAQTRLGGTTDLIEAWKGADNVVVIDAMMTGAPVGTVQTWEGQQPLASVRATDSTHGLGVAEAIELARVLNRLPARFRVYGIEGRRFGPGTEISAEVQHAIGEVVQKIIADEASVNCGRASRK